MFLFCFSLPLFSVFPSFLSAIASCFSFLADEADDAAAAREPQVTSDSVMMVNEGKEDQNADVDVDDDEEPPPAIRNPFVVVSSSSSESSSSSSSALSPSDSRVIADRVLHSSREMRAVHSTASVKAIVERAQQQQQQQGRAGGGGEVMSSIAEEPASTTCGEENSKNQSSSSPSSFPNPRIVVESAAKSERMKEHLHHIADTQNLPFIYRNPAI